MSTSSTNNKKMHPATRSGNMYCCVPGCRSEYGDQNQKKVSLFQIPRDPTLFTEWSRAIGRQDRQINSRHKVCDLHFLPSEISRTYKIKVGDVVTEIERGWPILCLGAVPSLGLGTHLPEGSSAGVVTKSKKTKTISLNSCCIVSGCRGGYRGEKKVSLFKAPTDPVLLAAWSCAIQMNDHGSVSSKNPVRSLLSSDSVCELHFLSSEINRTCKMKVENAVSEIEVGQPKLSVGAVPSVFSNFPRSDKIKELTSSTKVVSERKAPIIKCYIEPVQKKFKTAVQQSDYGLCKSELLLCDVVPPQEITFQWLCEHGSTLCFRDWICYFNDHYVCFGLLCIKDGQVHVKLSVSISKVMEVEIFCNGHKATIPSISNTLVDTWEKLLMILNKVQNSQECRGISDVRLTNAINNTHIGVLENPGVWRHKQCMRLSTTESISSLCRHCRIFQNILFISVRKAIQPSNKNQGKKGLLKSSAVRNHEAPSVSYAPVSKLEMCTEMFDQVSKCQENCTNSDDCQECNVWRLTNCTDNPERSKERKSLTKDESIIGEEQPLDKEFQLNLSTTDSQLNLSTKNASPDSGVELHEFILNGEHFEVRAETEYIDKENEIKTNCNNATLDSMSTLVNRDNKSDMKQLKPTLNIKSLKTKRLENNEDDKMLQDGVSCCLVVPNAFYAAQLMQDELLPRALQPDQGNPAKMVFKCKLCNKQFTVECCYQKHLKMHDQEWKCNICEKRFQSKSNLTRHKKHCNPRKLSKIVQRQDFLGRNRSKIPSVSCRPYRCDRCPTGHGSEESLAAHRAMVHSGESYFTVLDGSSKFFKCVKCDKKFRCKRELNVHCREYHMKKKFKCKYCEKCYALHSKLQRHLLVHDNKRNYQCEVCGSHFKFHSSLRRHEIVHSKEKPHVCDQCGKSFASPQYLKYHLSAHQRKEACL